MNELNIYNKMEIEKEREQVDRQVDKSSLYNRQADRQAGGERRNNTDRRKMKKRILIHC